MGWTVCWNIITRSRCDGVFESEMRPF